MPGKRRWARPCCWRPQDRADVRSWIHRLFARNPRTPCKAAPRFRPHVESLEVREAPAVPRGDQWLAAWWSAPCSRASRGEKAAMGPVRLFRQANPSGRPSLTAQATGPLRAQRSEVICLPGSARRAGAPARATALSDWLQR